MKSTEPQIGGYIRCLKSGSYQGSPYTKDKVYKIVDFTGKEKMFCDVIGDNGSRTLLCMEPADNKYGKEAQWLGMNHPEKEPVINNQYEIY